MKKKLSFIIFILSAILFVVGAFLVDMNIGRLGLTGFAGYTLCSLSIIVAICTVVTTIIMSKEEKRNEK